MAKALDWRVYGHFNKHIAALLGAVVMRPGDAGEYGSDPSLPEDGWRAELMASARVCERKLGMEMSRPLRRADSRAT